PKSRLADPLSPRNKVKELRCSGWHSRPALTLAAGRHLECGSACGQPANHLLASKPRLSTARKALGIAIAARMGQVLALPSIPFVNYLSWACKKDVDICAPAWQNVANFLDIIKEGLWVTPSGVRGVCYR
ncbi:MAG TPA: hypothetical protein VFB55_10880, partial [Verrucomicrobiae bacterium]|nr:hypothetical protein [Verrucomicrobiae bacterium]